MKTYCVYKHVSPDGRVYVGITSQKPAQRWQSGHGYKNNSYFTRAILKYGWDNFTHEILYDDLTEKEAKDIEISLITKLKCNERKYGFNISSGGESKKGTTISDWQKQRISEASKNRIVSKETREKLSKASKKTWSDESYRRHMREVNLGSKNPQYGKTRTPQEKLERGAKSVLQFDMDGNFIQEYVSLHDAADKTGISRSSISACCRGIYKQARGYIWKFKK